MKRMIYRIAKLLNHNSFIGIESGAKQECLIMGKGIVFGKKIGQTIEVPQEARIYSLKELTDRGDAREIINSVSPVCPLPWARARWTTPSSANGSTATTPTPPYCGTRSSSPPRRPIWRISKPCKQIHRITVNKP